MKKYYLIVVFVFASMVSCKNNGEKQAEAFSAELQPLTVTEVLAAAEDYANKEVIFKGLVNHVCSHSGKRCFMIDGQSSIRVEAMGNISSFTKEVSGNQIMVKGVLREKQLDEQYINDWEAKVQKRHNHAEHSEGCQSDFAEIEMMRDWMKQNNKNYYSIWYVDGTDYELVKF
jgi:hypothetical protein